MLDDLVLSRSSRSSSGSSSRLQLNRSEFDVTVPSSSASAGLFASRSLQDYQNIEVAGISLISWLQDKEKITWEFANFFYPAADLPHGLQDEIAALPEWACQADRMQLKLFEAAICRAEGPSGAPPIEIINTVDDQITPPFEFHYTNLMYHGPNVPRPEVKTANGCGCRGKCDPRSRTCSCARQQRDRVKLAVALSKYKDPPPKTFKGFVWDNEGRLITQLRGYPIIECSALCACDETCPNRVGLCCNIFNMCCLSFFLTGSTTWKESCSQCEKNKRQGLGCVFIFLSYHKLNDESLKSLAGIFAEENIQCNTFIGLYSGEYLTIQEGKARES